MNPVCLNAGSFKFASIDHLLVQGKNEEPNTMIQPLMCKTSRLNSRFPASITLQMLLTQINVLRRADDSMRFRAHHISHILYCTCKEGRRRCRGVKCGQIYNVGKAVMTAAIVLSNKCQQQLTCYAWSCPGEIAAYRLLLCYPTTALHCPLYLASL